MYFKQLLKLWSELGVNQKVSITLSFAGVIAGMVALLVWTSQPSMRMLYGKLESQDISEVLAIIEDQSIPYRIGEGGTSIYVPGDMVYKLRMDLAAKGIPNGGGVGFEIFDQGNFGISDFVQRTNYLRAVQGELSRTISQLQGIRSARVMVVVPENKLLVTNQKGRATASVFVDTGGGVLPQDAVNSIRFIVSNSVEGLLLDDVAVVDNHGKVLSEDLRQDGIAGIGTGQFKYRKSMEDYFVRKIESMLGKVVGPGNVVARVSVDVDSEASTIVRETFDPDGQVARSETNTEDTVTTSEARPNQSIGVAANSPQEGGQESATTNNTRESHKNKTTSYEINRSTKETVKAPGTIKEITAAVFIAMRTEGEGEDSKTLPRSAEEIGTLQRMVHNALGLDVSTQQGLVTLEETVFHTVEKAPEDSLVQLQDQFMRWYDVARNFFAVGIAVVMFIIFLRMVKRHKPGFVDTEIITEAGPRGIRQASDVSTFLTPELLNDLIREKPENVSTALKNWATNGPAGK